MLLAIASCASGFAPQDTAALALSVILASAPDARKVAKAIDRALRE